MRARPLSLALALWALAAFSRAQSPTFELVTSQTDNPSYLADPGDGRLFISELGGHIRVFANGVLQADNDAYLDLSGVVDFGGGEGGLHSFAFDPNYANNHFLYVEYTITGAGGSPLETVIERYTTDPNDPNHALPGSHHFVLRQQSPVGPDFANHKGGQLQFGPDGFLYFAFGDGGGANDPQCRSQTRDVLFGKMLRIDPSGDDFPGDPNQNYAIPATNPFTAGNDPNSQYRDEIYALGLRNPYRFSFDRMTGALWIGDVGQSDREEVDMEPSPLSGGGGRNYGWKMREGKTCHFATAAEASCPSYVAPCTDPGYTDPIDDYDRTVGSTVIGGFVYRGATIAWQGRYIFGDHGDGKLFALIPNGGSGFTRMELDKGDVGDHAPISFGEDHNGEMYVLADSVWRIRFDQTTLTKEQRDCIAKLNDGFDKIADVFSAQVRGCIDRFSQGKLGNSIFNCESPPNENVMKLFDKLGATHDKVCTDPTPPFGYAGGVEVGTEAAIEAEEQMVFIDLLTGDDGAVILKADDKAGAACQKAVLKAQDACAKTRRAEFLRCKKSGLKVDSIGDSLAIAACLNSDPKARITKSCDAEGKLGRAIGKSCVAKEVDLSNAFPVCDTDDPTDLANCIDRSARCNTCKLFDAADRLLETDCTEACQ